MVERGVGSWQLNKARTAVQTITRILKDGEWHRYQELREKTGLSSATLSKHLKELEKAVVEKKIQLKSGEYPYPVVYRIKKPYQGLFKIFSIPDARALGKKTRTSKKELTKATQKYLDLANQALSLSVNAALSTYAVERNFLAYQQLVDCSLTSYNEAVSTIQKVIDEFDEANRKFLAPVDGLNRISKELSSRIDEAVRIAQSKMPMKMDEERSN